MERFHYLIGVQDFEKIQTNSMVYALHQIIEKEYALQWEYTGRKIFWQVYLFHCRPGISPHGRLKKIIPHL